MAADTTTPHARPPMPRPTAVNRPFFEGCNAGVLRIQRCAAPACRRPVFYPRVCCPHCGHGALGWIECSGRGRVISYTVVHRPGHDAFLADAPYVFAAIGLEEGPTLYARVEIAPDAVAGLVGRAVRAVFREYTAGQKLPAFVPA